jgi:(1->4)-alpha-D-glucan 1-alpha-D-glucosylmutase
LQSWKPAKDCEPGCQARALLNSMDDGRIKLYLIWKTLSCRRRSLRLFQCGRYLPLHAHGPAADHLCAFAREYEGELAIVVVPRLCASLLGDKKQYPLAEDVWGDTRLELPGEIVASKFQNVFTNESIAAETDGGRATLRASAALNSFPVGLLLSTRVNQSASHAR